MSKAAERVPMVTLARALEVLPRYNSRNTALWISDGNRVQTNAKMIPDKLHKVISSIMGAVDKTHFKSEVMDVDVSGDDIWTIHRHLNAESLFWLSKRDWTKLQNWPRSKLPIYLRFKDKLIIWNGTHRMTLGRLRGLKVRARYFDLNKFQEWVKTHKPGWDNKVVKVFKRKKDAVALMKKLNDAERKKAAIKKAKARGNRK